MFLCSINSCEPGRVLSGYYSYGTGHDYHEALIALDTTTTHELGRVLLGYYS